MGNFNYELEFIFFFMEMWFLSNITFSSFILFNLQ